jgi:hypothetical protein
MKYILRVLDKEDDYVYFHMVFENAKDLKKVKEIIKNFNDKWYDSLYDEDSKYSGDYITDLYNELSSKGVDVSENTKIYFENVYVR